MHTQRTGECFAKAAFRVSESKTVAVIFNETVVYTCDAIHYSDCLEREKISAQKWMDERQKSPCSLLFGTVCLVRTIANIEAEIACIHSTCATNGRWVISRVTPT